jgi:copper chaperone
MIQKKYKIEGMSCQHCVKAVEIELSEIEIESFQVELGSADVKFDNNKISEKAIEKAVEEAGFIIVK